MTESRSHRHAPSKVDISATTRETPFLKRRNPNSPKDWLNPTLLLPLHRCERRELPDLGSTISELLLGGIGEACAVKVESAEAEEEVEHAQEAEEEKGGNASPAIAIMFVAVVVVP